MRVFIAFEIQADLQQAVLAYQSAFRSKLSGIVRPIKPENLHCTVLFFKNLPPEDLDRIIGFLKQLPPKTSLSESIDWREFQLWKGLICLTGESSNNQLTSWLRANLPEDIAQKANWSHLLLWKPHITLIRASAKSFLTFQEQAESLLPQPFANPQKNFSFPAISIFKSPPEAESGIYERLFSLPLTY